MAVYKRGGVWWYSFVFRAERIQESTKQGNKRVAEQMEAAHKTSLAKGEFGIRERKAVPTLRDFSQRFMEAIEVRCANKPRTVDFYRQKLKALLNYPPMAGAKVDQIDEAVIDRYVAERREKVSPATTNRELATLRRALRLAYSWKVINRVPAIRLLPGEHIREFVLSHDQERLYLQTAPQPLADVALLILDTGLRVGEALALQWPDVHLEPTSGARYGYLQVRDGKSRNARRAVSLTQRVRSLLQSRANRSICAWVFPGETAGPFVGTSLNHQHQRVRALLKLPKDFVIHSLRHTMLTRLGEAGVDAFTIMRIAGHSSVTVTQRYVHPSGEAMERAFERLEALNGRMVERTPEVPGLQQPSTVSATVSSAVPVSH